MPVTALFLYSSDISYWASKKHTGPPHGHIVIEQGNVSKKFLDLMVGVTCSI